MERPVENLIFDRTSTDVLNAKNNPNNSISNRGNYNISDFASKNKTEKIYKKLLMISVKRWEICISYIFQLIVESNKN